jgi:hypothetical protein
MLNLFRKDKVIFSSSDKRFINHYPPIYSKELSRDFLKDLHKHHRNELDNISKPTCPFVRSMNTARCPGILDMINTGYIFRLHRDIRIRTNGDGKSFFSEVMGYRDPTSPDVSHFGPEQFGDYYKMPPNTLKTLIKINLPWMIESTNYNLLQTQPSFVEEDRFTVVEGILNPNKGREINIILFWHMLNDTVVLTAGTPICQIIPIRDTPKFLCKEDTNNLHQKVLDFNYRRFSTNNQIDKFIE